MLDAVSQKAFSCLENTVIFPFIADEYLIELLLSTVRFKRRKSVRQAKVLE